ncbi:MAG: ATP-binding cassette domain-containing protein, partial [Thermogladius sp.]|nr:ATP-binding cassette domain-containing protein [Thermogladius sp.]
MDEREALRTVDLTKRFGGITALKKVSFDVKYGEVHAIVGQNGAGKSTLVKIINGIHTPDDGSIFIDGKPVKIKSPRDAKILGITLIHQERMLFPNLTVA